jgi:glutathione-specific gamma-glutamylcyclotransferase
VLQPSDAELAPATDDDVWLFGYGSLMWRPDLPYLARSAATLDGYRRRFWQRSSDHRGTAERPGRVVTLVAAAEARTLGVAYRLAAPAETLPRIDYREQQGYQRRTRSIRLADGTARTALVYVADPDNPYFVADEARDATAAIIAAAHGPSGANLDYARRLVQTLDELVAAYGAALGCAPGDHTDERELLARAEAYARAVDGVGPRGPAG